jgi:NAD(P)-dependent dehydrogenase (short-subunit alcohol dehydrogenase family)
MKRVALVTGANRGIGFEIARQLAAAGVDVVGTSRDRGGGEAAARKLGVRFVTLDVEDRSSVDALPAAFTDGLDILVNNAGISLHGFDEEIARRTLAVNFFGPMHVTDRLLPLLRRGGRVVMVSSGLGEVGALSPDLRDKVLDTSLTRAGLVALMESFVREVAAGTHTRHGWPTSAYRVSKIGLNALTRVLARELEGDSRAIAVNACSPGWVRTAMGGEGAPLSAAEGAKTPVWLALQGDDAPTGGYFENERPTPW